MRLSILLPCRLGMALLCACAAVILLSAPQQTGPAEIAIGAMLAVASIWLMFGVRTRVMAALSTVLLTGHALLMGPASSVPDGLPLLAALFSLPLALFGGGSFALYSRGWREIL